VFIPKAICTANWPKQKAPDPRRRDGLPLDLPPQREIEIDVCSTRVSRATFVDLQQTMAIVSGSSIPSRRTSS
jgi:hypothetical protein